MKIVAIVGFGKITAGLLQPAIKECSDDDVVFIAAVRNTDEWLKRQLSLTMKTIIKDSDGRIVSDEIWEINRPDESFKEFANRCCETNKSGIMVMNDDSVLKDIIVNADVLGTSVGMCGLSEVLQKISKLTDVPKCQVFAFENSPQAVEKIVSEYKMEDRVVHCPVDMVVTDRLFDDAEKTTTVILGQDKSRNIMIYDKYGCWNNILKKAEGSVITVTKDSSQLRASLIRKNGCKNVPHKVLCHRICSHFPVEELKDRSPAELVQNDDLLYMEQVKKPLVISVLISAYRNNGSITADRYLKEAKDFEAYFETSVECLANEKNDTIGRILHLHNGDEEAKADKDRLVNTIKAFNTVLHCEAAAEFIEALKPAGYNEDAKSYSYTLEKIINDIT